MKLLIAFLALKALLLCSHPPIYSHNTQSDTDVVSSGPNPGLALSGVQCLAQEPFNRWQEELAIEPTVPYLWHNCSTSKTTTSKWLRKQRCRSWVEKMKMGSHLAYVYFTLAKLKLVNAATKHMFVWLTEQWKLNVWINDTPQLYCTVITENWDYSHHSSPGSGAHFPLWGWRFALYLNYHDYILQRKLFCIINLVNPCQHLHCASVWALNSSNQQPLNDVSVTSRVKLGKRALKLIVKSYRLYPIIPKDSENLEKSFCVRDKDETQYYILMIFLNFTFECQADSVQMENIHHPPPVHWALVSFLFTCGLLLLIVAAICLYCWSIIIMYCTFVVSHYLGHCRLRWCALIYSCAQIPVFTQ